MTDLGELFERNRAWAKATAARDPDFFATLAEQQSPAYLWIGCSDSRVPANQILDLRPGDVFVHRNVANVVVHTDLNCLSVLQYAVEVLRVRDVIVCGHYGCGGVAAAVEGTRHGLIDNWLRHVADVAESHAAELAALGNEERLARLCELNVVEQVANVCGTTIVQDAWARGEDLTVHGLVYDLEDGLLRDLDVSRSRGLPMGAERVVVVRPGKGRHVGNVEFLARSADTPRFNLAIVTIQPRRLGPPSHRHTAEDDAFYMLEGELVFTADGEEVVAGPGTFVLVPPGVEHTFENRTDAVARFVNVHAPAGFDIRLEED